MFLIGNRERSSAIALEDPGSGAAWTYADLAAAARQVASLLPANGVPSLVFLFCRNQASAVAGYIGTIHARSAVAMLDANLATEFKQNLIDLYQPDFLFGCGSDPSFDGYQLLESPVPSLFIRSRMAQAAEIPHPDLALLLSTSGSTGTPKFVRLTRGNIEANAAGIAEALAITNSDRPITTLPLHYSYGLSVLNSHLSAGATVVLTDKPLTSSEFWSALRDANCTSMAGVPYSYQILKRLNIDALNVPTLNTMTQAGGKLSDALISHFHQVMASRRGRFFVMYGQTEATARISILPAEALPAKLGSAGVPLRAGTLQVDSGGALISEPGIAGELVYSGPNVMMGYATCRGDLAAGDVNRGVLRTGDIGYMDADGYVFITGRGKRDAKIYGLRVNMDELEAMMRIHGPTAVVEGTDRLVLFCEYGDDNAFSGYARELAAKLKLHAGAFQFRRVDRLPLNANGKIDYQQLTQMQ